MRYPVREQRLLGTLHISQIEIDLRCRDEIPKLLLGLQHLYCTEAIRNEVFQILAGMIPATTSKDNGRPGMELWKILVLGCVRICCDLDYDKLHDLSNNHLTIREFLGHGLFDNSRYSLQRLKDNISMFTPEILERINDVVIKAGHKLVRSPKKNEKNELKCRCDSFVVETDVHYPTDINLLFDAVRKTITLISKLCDKFEISGWRKSTYNIKTFKRTYQKIQKMKQSTSKDDTKKSFREAEIKKLYQRYISMAELYFQRTEDSLLELKDMDNSALLKAIEIEGYLNHGYRQVDQIRRRVLYSETIPHEEKVFSIFEEHTEWISKGKAGVPQQLGLRICIIEDQFKFILLSRVMQKETDEKVAVPMIKQAKAKYPQLKSCSFDKGFYSPSNRAALGAILDLAILPKKGRLSKQDQEIEGSYEFGKGRCKHSAVESAIHGLINHGLDRCMDKGIKGFKRFVSLAVLARNIHVLGSVIHKKKMKQLKRNSQTVNKPLLEEGFKIKQLTA